MAPIAPVAEPTEPTDVPSKPRDPSVTCYEITARNSKANDKFVVPLSRDLYHCFNYAPPWGAKNVQLVSSRPLISNQKLLQHSHLYIGDDIETAPEDGSHADCVAAHPGLALVSVWAPGAGSFEAPADVGVELAGGRLLLENHYDNSVGEGQQDQSGVEVCVTDEPRPKAAAIHWLGTEQIDGVEATGTCRPTSTDAITVLRSTPHMRRRGRHLKTVIERAAGGTETLLDEAFDFDTQSSYSTPAVVHPGDTLTTTCTYASPSAFGTGTNSEACYNFVLAYPAGALAQPLEVLRKYDCLGGFSTR